MRNELMCGLIISAAGCTGTTSSEEDAETQQSVSQSADFAEQALRASTLAAGFAGQLGHAQGPPMIALLTCGAQPQLTYATVCGHDYPATVQLVWSGCSPRPGIVTDGTAEVTNQIQSTGECGPSATLSIDHRAQLVLDATRADGGTMQSDGSIHVMGTRAIGAPPSSLQLDLDVTRSMQGAKGAASAHATGSYALAFDAAANPPRSTANGSLTVTIDSPRGSHDLAIEAIAVVREPTACGFPIGGSIDIDAGGTSHVLTFGPACGEATLDGAAVTLPLSGISSSFVRSIF